MGSLGCQDLRVGDKKNWKKLDDKELEKKLSRFKVISLEATVPLVSLAKKISALLMESFLTSVSTGYREISASCLISRPVAGVLISQFVQAGGTEGARYCVTRHTVRCQMSSLGYLVWILRLWQLGYEAGILSVEIDEHEDCEDNEADETVRAESRGRTCTSNTETITVRTSL